MTFKSGYIALLGAPNAGKSTLTNAILNEKLAIVSDKPQTTRKKFLGIYSEPGVQMIFLDTPGVHESQKLLNQSMLNQIEEAIADADILCFLVAANERISQEMKDLTARVSGRFQKKPRVVVLNKVDLAPDKLPDRLEAITKVWGGIPTFSISAINRQGVPELVAALKEMLPEGPAYFPEDDLTDVSLRDLASECIREKAMEMLHQEIPYALAVDILQFKESPEITRIEANLIVDQDSQKGMVIGYGGKMIKEIGSRARVDLQKLIGTKIFLGLQVKVDKNWTKNPAKMAQYGYALPPKSKKGAG